MEGFTETVTYIKPHAWIYIIGIGKYVTFVLREVNVLPSKLRCYKIQTNSCKSIAVAIKNSVATLYLNYYSYYTHM